MLEHLRKKYSIRLELPSLKRLLTDKINLKIFKSPLGEGLSENRYRVLIGQAEELLRRNIINTEKIKEFGESFFETINQDLLVLQNNEEIRRSFTRIRDQITYRIEELTVEQKRMEEECKRIGDKEDILIFLEGSFKAYLANVKVVSDHYDGINSAQVFTSINIDAIYSEKLAQEEDYLQHYQPLLEVMQRLKANMLRLYQELNRCEYYELPLKSVNFLANCKNLLLELEPFLIRPDCVFNRLIFHVTRGQKENNRLISNVFQANIAFTNDIVSDIFKSFFLGHIFKDYYLDLKAKIAAERLELIAYFENRLTNLDNFNSFAHKVDKKLLEAQGQVAALKRVIGLGKDKIMRHYLGRKECKKGKLLAELEDQAARVRTLARTMAQLLKYKSRTQLLAERGGEAERHVQLTIGALRELEENGIKSAKPASANLRELEEQLQRRIEESYLLIQEGVVAVHGMLAVLREAREEEDDPYFNEGYFPRQEEALRELVLRYNEAEIALLNSYQNLRREKLQKAEETLQVKALILEQLNDYFEARVSGEMGFEIRNEDAECEEVKDNIVKVEKMQFMMHNYLAAQNPAELEELARHKANLEWLLQVFEGSMDEQIFEKFVQKLSFEAQDWREQAARVRELLKELARYVGVLKAIARSGNISRINQKVFKLVKNRTQLYEIIQDLYEEFVLVFESCKERAHLNLSDHGLRIFDEPTYRYVLMLYQYKNRLRAEAEEIKDLLLPPKTVNYLIDELYEPFMQLFNAFAGFTEQELLNFTLRLEHALNLKNSQQDILALFERTLAKPYHKGFFPAARKICQELARLGEENRKVLQLEDEEVMIYNLPEFKERAQAISEHIAMAEAVLAELQGRNLVLELDLNDQNLNILCAKLAKEWQ